MSEDQPTCGKGIAYNSALPRALGKVVEGTARVLEHHMKALDLTDTNSRRENDAYASLARQHREIAAKLADTAAEMASYRDLPMGRHDMARMMAPESREVFAALIQTEEELVALLQQRLAESRKLLGQM